MCSIPTVWVMVVAMVECEHEWEGEGKEEACVKCWETVIPRCPRKPFFDPGVPDWKCGHPGGCPSCD